MCIFYGPAHLLSNPFRTYECHRARCSACPAERHVCVDDLELTNAGWPRTESERFPKPIEKIVLTTKF